MSDFLLRIQTSVTSGILYRHISHLSLGFIPTKISNLAEVRQAVQLHAVYATLRVFFLHSACIPIFFFFFCFFTPGLLSSSSARARSGSRDPYLGFCAACRQPDALRFLFCFIPLTACFGAYASTALGCVLLVLHQ